MGDQNSMPAQRNDFAILDALAVGESTAFPVGLYFKLSPVLTYRQKRDGKKFTRRTDGEVVRVWRVE